MKFRFNLFSLFLILFMANMLYSQNSNSKENPFDIPNRKQEVKTSSLSTKNVFDIQNRSTQTEIPASSSNLNTENPFEVSHVPLKKTKKIGHRKQFLKEKNSLKSSLILWVLSFLLILLAIIINTKSKIIHKIVQSLANENLLKSLQKDENGGRSVHYILLYILFFISLATFLYLVLNHWFGIDDSSLYFKLILVISSFFIVKHSIAKLVAHIYPIQKESDYFNFTIENYALILGIILLPINFILAFSSPFFQTIAIYFGLFSIAIYVILTYARGLLISVKYLVYNFLYFFIYLCTLEIAPLVFITKIIKQSF